MKIGICDSGLGGLIIAKAIKQHLPDYDFVYCGDTLHLPYGQRSRKVIYDLTLNMVKFLFEQDCKLIIIACNTACAVALRDIQQKFLPQHYPDRNVLGVVVPMLEEIRDQQLEKVALLGTEGLVRTRIYTQELAKISHAHVDEVATPLFVPLIENNGDFLLEQTIQHYMERHHLSRYQAVILGCTHYALIKPDMKHLLGEDIAVLSQDDIIPQKLAAYLKKHQHYNGALSKNSTIQFYVSDYTERYQHAANKLFGSAIQLESVASF